MSRDDPGNRATTPDAPDPSATAGGPARASSGSESSGAIPAGGAHDRVAGTGADTLAGAGSGGDPLELDPETMRRLGHRVVDMIVDRIAGLDEEPVWRVESRAALDRRLREPPPAAPADDIDALLDRLADDVLAFAGRIDHPRFFAFVPGCPTWPGILGELLAAGYNVFQGTWLESAGPSALELVVLDWFKEWIGYPDDAAGVLVSGGSAANLNALVCAREFRLGPDDGPGVVYLSDQTHSSVERAARIAGFPADRIRTLPTDASHRLAPETLRAAIEEDALAGRRPVLVVSNAGATNTGAVDPLPELADVCAERGVWLHVDAAYGGYAVLTERGRALLEGIERADSVTLDPHKWLYQPFEAGCLLVRRGELLDRAFHIMPDYLQDTETRPEGAASVATGSTEAADDGGARGGEAAGGRRGRGVDASEAEAGDATGSEPESTRNDGSENPGEAPIDEGAPVRRADDVDRTGAADRDANGAEAAGGWRVGGVNFADRGLQLTRSSRVMKIWLSIQTFGVNRFRAAIDRCIDLALHAQRQVEATPELELLAPAQLGIVCFRRRPAGWGRTPANGVPDDASTLEERLERVNASLVERLSRSGVGMISSTRLDGRYALRLCILNHRSGEEDVDRVLDWLATAPIERV